MAGEYPRLFGHYLLLEAIGIGGFGVVHLAVRAGEDVLVVLKTLRSDLLEDDEPNARFQHEVKLSARLVGKHFARVLEAGAVNGTPYLAMEYAPGTPLRSLLKHLTVRGTTLARSEAALIARGVLESVQALHETRAADGARLEIIHRDINPANLIVGSDLNVRLIDLGIGRSAVGEVETRTGAVVGSLGYLAPEQVLGKRIDQRTDQFACALIIWELFSGERLIPLGDLGAVLMRTAKLKYRPLRALHPALPVELDVVLKKALKKKPHNRFESVRAFAEALEPIFAALPANEKTTSAFAEVYVPARTPQQLEALRWLARASELTPADEPTIFATMVLTEDEPEGELSISPSMIEKIVRIEATASRVSPEPQQTLTPLIVYRRVRARASVAWTLAFVALALIVISTGLSLGFRLSRDAEPEAQPIRAVMPEQHAPAVQAIARPNAEPIEIKKARAKPRVIDEPRPVVVAEPKRQPEPVVVKAEPQPEPELEDLVQRATRLRGEAPALAPELDSVLADLALEARRNDPARLKQIELRLRRLERR